MPSAPATPVGVILAANGPVFSAGHNFGDMAGATLADARQLFEVCTEMMDTVQAIPQPVVRQGARPGDGGGLPARGHLRPGGRRGGAAFAIPGGKGGLFCHTPLVAVARNIGRKRALEMAFTGDPIDARTAADWGLVNRVVPGRAARRGHPRPRHAGRSAAAPSRRRSASTPSTPRSTCTRPRPTRYAIEVMAANALTADAQEGIAAFLEKRKPTFGAPPAG